MTLRLLHHICFGAPGLRSHYGPHYYAAFVVDPEGHRIETALSFMGLLPS